MATNKEEIWQALQAHHRTAAPVHMRDLFAGDADRIADFSIKAAGLFIDYSKNRITRETVDLLVKLAGSVDLTAKITALMDGARVNTTENRPALHTALRRPADKPLVIDGTDITALVQRELERIKQLVGRLHNGQLVGSTGKPIRKVVNIGIGGSDLGPRLVAEALYEYRTPVIEVDFVANLDAHDLHRVLDTSDPETTLFIVTSKSFTTMETHSNARSARGWLMENGCQDINRHFIAVSSNRKAVLDFGIAEDRIFDMWDWVGGRYSVWSTVGLPVAVAIGMDQFRDFLGGAYVMDRHFGNTAPDGNLPVLLGLLDIWYNNFFGAETRVVVPYDQRLRLLPEYLSQLVMESNGKGVTDDGRRLNCHSTPVVWGSIGTNAQHAFFQMLHQGTRLVPVEFLLPLNSAYGDHHKVVANCLAQGKALMLGRENRQEPHRNFPGNRPSTTIIYDNLTPATLGTLLAMYEHRTYVQACIWGINAFDQWGVELGKSLANEIIDELEGKTGKNTEHDASTARLIDYFQSNRN